MYYHDDSSSILVGRSIDTCELMHYRTPGSKNGIRNWQNEDGSYTPAGAANGGRYSQNGQLYGNEKKTRAEKKLEKAVAKQKLTQVQSTTAKMKAETKTYQALQSRQQTEHAEAAKRAELNTRSKAEEIAYQTALNAVIVKAKQTAAYNELQKNKEAQRHEKELNKQEEKTQLAIEKADRAIAKAKETQQEAIAANTKVEIDQKNRMAEADVKLKEAQAQRQQIENAKNEKENNKSFAQKTAEDFVKAALPEVARTFGQATGQAITGAIAKKVLGDKETEVKEIIGQAFASSSKAYQTAALVADAKAQKEADKATKADTKAQAKAAKAEAKAEKQQTKQEKAEAKVAKQEAKAAKSEAKSDNDLKSAVTKQANIFVQSFAKSSNISVKEAAGKLGAFEKQYSASNPSPAAQTMYKAYMAEHPNSTQTEQAFIESYYKQIT